jgi:hypothetical protein
MQHYTSLESYVSQGTMLLYSSESITNSGIGFIVTSFNKNICQTVHIIAVYKPPSLSLTTFLHPLKTYIKFFLHMSHNFLGDFNVDALQKKTSKATYLCQFMNVIKTSISTKYHNIWFATVKQSI